MYFPIQKQWADSMTFPARLIERTQPILGTRIQCTTLMSRPGLRESDLKRLQSCWMLLGRMAKGHWTPGFWVLRTCLYVFVCFDEEQQAMQKQATELRRMKKRQRQMTPRHKELKGRGRDCSSPWRAVERMDFHVLCFYNGSGFSISGGSHAIGVEMSLTPEKRRTKLPAMLKPQQAKWVLKNPAKDAKAPHKK